MSKDYLRVVFEGETTGVYCGECAGDALVALSELMEWELREDMAHAEQCDGCSSVIRPIVNDVSGNDFYGAWLDRRVA